MSNCKVIALTNQKGGVGKTTTAVNLGVGLAKQEKRVLLIDADAQANLTMALGYSRPDDLPITLSTIMQNIIDDKSFDVSQGILSHSEGVDLLPSNIELSGFEVRLINAMSRERVLKTYVNEVKKSYDYVLIDCMPSLGMITINALAAADSVVIPTQPHYLSAKGLELLLRSVSMVKRQINPKLRIDGILMTMVEKYARENGISEYVNVLLAIIQVESGGTAEDVMQSSESLGLPPNSLDTESSIKQGCKYFASLLSSCKNQGIDDLNVAIQSYNYGGGYVGYVAGKGKKHTFNLAESFAREKSGGKKVTYTNPIAVAKNGGWRYGYGNMFYVEVVNQYLAVPQVSGELAQKVMNEALKYQGWKYVYGGSNPNTSFDCSGLTQWCYGKAGISLPRTAQAQYDATQHLPLSQAKAGDLVFFHSTYNAGSYVTHVGILVSPTQMYHAGDPIGYADLSSSYWQQHLIGAGRVKQ